jgi:hypothetical protein
VDVVAEMKLHTANKRIKKKDPYPSNLSWDAMACILSELRDLDPDLGTQNLLVFIDGNSATIGRRIVQLML